MYNQTEVKKRLDSFRNVLWSLDHTFTIPKKGKERDLEFDNILRDLRDFVFLPLEKCEEWSIIERILDYIVDNRLNLPMNIRKQSAIDIIDLADSQRFTEIDNYFRFIFLSPMDLRVQDYLRRKDFSLKDFLGWTASAGLTLDQARSLNFEYGKALIRIKEERDKNLDKAMITVAKETALSQGQLGSVSLIQSQSGTGFVNKVDYKELERSFIEDKNLVRIMCDGDPKIYEWSEDTKRYVPFKTNLNIKSALKIYAYEKYGEEIELSSYKVDSIVDCMLYRSVPLLGDSSDVELSSDMQVFFRNGYYNLRNNCYRLCDTRKYFHVFCLPYELCEQYYVPSKFDEFLDVVFKKNERKKRLAKEMIGAIISNVPLKNVFVLQGVSNGGKSTLAKIIMSLLNDDEVKELGSINDISEVKIKPYEGKFKLLYIDDAPNDRWNNSTVSYLKTCSNGMDKIRGLGFKTLLSTNYPVYFKTYNGRDESMENRIIALSFEEDLKLAGQYDYRVIELIEDILNGGLEEEKIDIVYDSLSCFGEVLKNKRNFDCCCTLNDCVVVCGSNKSFFNEEIGDTMESSNYSIEVVKKQTISDKNRDLVDWLRNNFEVTDKEEEFTTAEQIFEYIKMDFPETNGRVNDVGRVVKFVFGDEVCSGKRISSKICYRIKFKVLEG